MSKSAKAPKVTLGAIAQPKAPTLSQPAAFSKPSTKTFSPKISKGLVKTLNSKKFGAKAMKSGSVPKTPPLQMDVKGG